MAASAAPLPDLPLQRVLGFIRTDRSRDYTVAAFWTEFPRVCRLWRSAFLDSLRKVRIAVSVVDPERSDDHEEWTPRVAAIFFSMSSFHWPTSSLRLPSSVVGGSDEIGLVPPTVHATVVTRRTLRKCTLPTSFLVCVANYFRKLLDSVQTNHYLGSVQLDPFFHQLVTASRLSVVMDEVWDPGLRTAADHHVFLNAACEWGISSQIGSMGSSGLKGLDLHSDMPKQIIRQLPPTLKYFSPVVGRDFDASALLRFSSLEALDILPSQHFATGSSSLVISHVGKLRMLRILRMNLYDAEASLSGIGAILSLPNLEDLASLVMSRLETCNAILGIPDPLPSLRTLDVNVVSPYPVVITSSLACIAAAWPRLRTLRLSVGIAHSRDGNNQAADLESKTQPNDTNEIMSMLPEFSSITELIFRVPKPGNIPRSLRHLCNRCPRLAKLAFIIRSQQRPDGSNLFHTKPMYATLAALNAAAQWADLHGYVQQASCDLEELVIDWEPNWRNDGLLFSTGPKSAALWLKDACKEVLACFPKLRRLSLFNSWTVFTNVSSVPYSKSMAWPSQFQPFQKGNDCKRTAPSDHPSHPCLLALQVPIIASHPAGQDILSFVSAALPSLVALSVIFFNAGESITLPPLPSSLRAVRAALPVGVPASALLGPLLEVIPALKRLELRPLFCHDARRPPIPGLFADRRVSPRASLAHWMVDTTAAAAAAAPRTIVLDVRNVRTGQRLFATYHDVLAAARLFKPPANSGIERRTVIWTGLLATVAVLQNGGWRGTARAIHVAWLPGDTEPAVVECDTNYSPLDVFDGWGRPNFPWETMAGVRDRVFGCEFASLARFDGWKTFGAQWRSANES